jgi:polysaccharide export outer membrane protein
MALAAATALACTSCKGPGEYVWVDSYTDRGGDPGGGYLIAPGDVIQVKVFNQEQLTTRAKVRADGKVSLPLVNDVRAAGLTPVALAADLQEQLKQFVKAPLVTVSVEESRPAVVYVAGEVAKPAPYPIESCSGVLQALINAGGLTVNARTDRIFVLRQAHPAALRIRFTYDDLTRLSGRAPNFQLRPGDVVVVE